MSISGVRPSLEKIDLLLEKWGGRDISIHPPKTTWFSSLKAWFKTPVPHGPRFSWLKEGEKAPLVQSLRTFGFNNLKEEIFNRLERTRALKAAYQNTHYLFTHSSNPELLAVYLFYREFERLKHPERDMSHWVPFRDPSIMDNREAIMAERNKRIGLGDFDDVLPTISADIYDLSTETAESAICFAMYCANERGGLAFKETRNGSSVFRNWSFPEEFKEEFSNLVDESIRGGKANISWAILVPQASALKAGYLSHWYGIPCKCCPERQEEIFKQLQRGSLTKESACRTDDTRNKPPQYRLYPEQLTPENGVIIEYFSNFSNREIEDMTQKLAVFAKKVFNSMFKIKN